MLSLERMLEIAKMCGVEVSDKSDGNHYIMDSNGNYQVLDYIPVPFVSFESSKLNFHASYKPLNESYTINKIDGMSIFGGNFTNIAA